MRSLLFSLGHGAHETLYAPSKNEVSVSSIPVEFLRSNRTGLQCWILLGLSSQCQTPRLGSLTWGSELSLLWENFCDIILFQLYKHHHSLEQRVVINLLSKHACERPMENCLPTLVAYKGNLISKAKGKKLLNIKSRTYLQNRSLFSQVG